MRCCQPPSPTSRSTASRSSPRQSANCALLPGIKADPTSRLLPQPFTLLQLRMLHETILGEALQKDTFRRRMEPNLQPTERIAEGTVGRPARLFSRS